MNKELHVAALRLVSAVRGYFHEGGKHWRDEIDNAIDEILEIDREIQNDET